MAYALVANAAASGTGLTATTGAIDTTGADILFVYLALASTVTVAPTDSKSNTWVATTQTVVAGGEKGILYYAKNPNVGAGHTFTSPSTASSLPAVFAAAFSGAHLTGPLDQQAQANGYPGPVTLGSITGSAGSIVISGVSFNVAGTMRITAGGLTILDQVNRSAGVCLGGALAWGTVTDAIATGWDNSVNSSIASMQATFHSASGGGVGGGGTTGTGSTLLLFGRGGV